VWQVTSGKQRPTRNKTIKRSCFLAPQKAPRSRLHRDRSALASRPHSSDCRLTIADCRLSSIRLRQESNTNTTQSEILLPLTRDQNDNVGSGRASQASRRVGMREGTEDLWFRGRPATRDGRGRQEARLHPRGLQPLPFVLARKPATRFSSSASSATSSQDRWRPSRSGGH
jgi:hypothetical protein